MRIDWSTASIEDRKALYRVFKSILDEHGMRSDSAFRQAYANTAYRGKDSEDIKNFRSGRIDKKRAGLLYQWILENYPKQAQEIADAVYSAKPKPLSWNGFLVNYGAFTNLEIELFQGGAGVIGFASNEPLTKCKIEREQKFCFRLDSPINAAALALQGYKGTWHCLPLAKDTLHVPVVQGKQSLPHVHGEAIPLWEEDDMGKHRFVFLVAEQGTIEGLSTVLSHDSRLTHSELDTTATTLFNCASDWYVFRLNVLFVDRRI